MKRYYRMMICGLAALLASGVARADVNWSYTTSNSNPIIAADNQATTAGAINFTSLSSASATGSSNIQLATVSLTPLVSTTAATFTAPTFSFSLAITSGSDTQSVNISGKFYNNLNSALNPLYTNKGSSVTISFNQTDFFLPVNGNLFEIKLPSSIYVPAPFPTGTGSTAAQFTTVTASVIVDTGTTGPTGGSGGTQQVPEPSTMLLGLFGLSACGAAAWRKRKNGKNNPETVLAV